MFTREMITRFNPRSAPVASTFVIASDAIIHTNLLLKLPNINLPTCDGKYDKWVTFRDTFEAIIDSNTNLTNNIKILLFIIGRKAQHNAFSH